MKNKFLRTLIIFWFMVALSFSNGSGSACADITTGLVGWWKMDEATGVNLTDSSGNGNTGTPVGSPVTTSGCARGKCLNFNGTNYVNAGNNASFDLTQSITISAWVKTTTAVFSPILWKGDSNGGAPNFYNLYRFMLGANGKAQFMFVLTDGSLGQNAGSTSVNDGAWHHVVGIRDWSASLIYVYIDGASNASPVSFSGTLKTSTKNLYIGCNIVDDTAFYTDTFNGLIDDVRIYNRALTAADVRELSRSSIIHNGRIKNAVLH